MLPRTPDSLQNRIRLRSLDRSRLTLNRIGAKKFRKVLLKLRSLSQTTFDRSGISTQPSFVEDVEYTCGGSVKSLILYAKQNLTILLLFAVLSKYLYGGEFSHLEPARDRIDLCHAHYSFQTSSVVILDLVRTIKINIQTVY